MISSICSENCIPLYLRASLSPSKGTIFEFFISSPKKFFCLMLNFLLLFSSWKFDLLTLEKDWKNSPEFFILFCLKLIISFLISSFCSSLNKIRLTFEHSSCWSPHSSKPGAWYLRLTLNTYPYTWIFVYDVSLYPFYVVGFGRGAIGGSDLHCWLCWLFAIHELNAFWSQVTLPWVHSEFSTFSHRSPWDESPPSLMPKIYASRVRPWRECRLFPS